MNTLLFAIVAVSLYGFGSIEGVNVWDDLTLSSKEKMALDKFKLIMNDSLPHDFMRRDIYLIKWLRARDLNLKAATQMLRQHLDWRVEYQIDSISNEDFSDVKYRYPYTSDGMDYEGRPVLAVNAADWDIRRAIIQGDKDRLIRYAFGAYEVANEQVRRLQSEGKNITQFTMVCNFDGFNLIQHGCLQCIQVLVNFLASYEANFPGMADNIMAIKTPATFEIVLQALKTVMSKETAAAVSIWGPDPRIWKRNLLKVIPADQLDQEFGGTRLPSF